MSQELTQGLCAQNLSPDRRLAGEVQIDLVGLDKATARDTLLAGMRCERAKPTTAPGFPESQPRAVPQQPLFPGTASPQRRRLLSLRVSPYQPVCGRGSCGTGNGYGVASAQRC